MRCFRQPPRLRACARAVLDVYVVAGPATGRSAIRAAPGAALLVASGLLMGNAAAQTTCPSITVSNQSISITSVESSPCANTGMANTITIATGAGLIAGGSGVTSFTVGSSFPNLVGLGATVLINNGTIGSASAARSIDSYQSGTGTSNSPAGNLRIENNGTIIGQIRQVIVSDGSGSGGGGGYSAPLTIVNTGQILANAASTTVIADFTQNNSGQNFLLNNSGLIRGDLALGNSPDMVINSGTIEGNIDLGTSQQRKGTLVLRPGWSITGVVRSSDTASDVTRGRPPASFVLSGEGASSFDTSTIGAYSATATTPQFQGFGNFYKQGPSTWTLTGTANASYRPANNVAPQWWISGGTLIANTAALPWGVTFGARALSDIATGAMAGDPDYVATAGSAATLVWNQTVDGTYGGTVGECSNATAPCAVPIVGRVEKTGAGTLTLSTSANAYSGGTTIRQGVLAISGDGALGAATGSVDLAGGSLRTSSNIVSGRIFTVSSASGIDVATGTLALSTGLAGDAALTKSGAGTLALNAAGSYSGELTLAQGTLTLGATDALGSGSLRTTGSIIDYADGVTNAAPIIIDSNSTQLQVASGSASQAGAVSEAGGARPLEKIGAGTLILANTANSYSGGTTVGAGTLAVTADGALGASTGGLTLAGGTLRVDAGFASGRALAVSGSSTVDVGTHTLTWTGSLGGSGSLTKQGSGSLSFNGAGAAYTGSATVAAGRLQIGGSFGGGSSTLTVASGATLGGTGSAGGAVSIADGARLAPGGIGSTGTLTVGALTLNPGSLLDYRLGASSDLAVVQGNFTLDGTVNATGGGLSGAYRLFNFNTVGGSFTDNGLDLGSLPAGYGGVIRVGSGVVNLVLNRGTQNVQLWNGNGAGGGGGTWNAANANWLDAQTLVTGPWGAQVGVFGGSGGTVDVDGAQNFQGLQFTANGYSLSAGAGGALVPVGDAAGNSGASFINVDGGVTAVLDVPLTGSLGIDKFGSGTLVLAAANTYSGPTDVKAGTLRLGASDRLATGSALTVSGGSFDLGGYTQTLDTVTLTAGSISNGTLTAGSATVQAGSVSASLAGSGTLTKSGSGTVVLSGLNTYSGATLIQNGTLRAGSSQTFSVNSAVALTDAAGAVLDLNGTDQSIGALAGGGASGGNVTLGAGRLTVGGNDADSSYAGRISGSGGLTKVGAGVLTLTGSNSYSGSTRVQAGTLALSGGTALADSGAVEIATGASLLLQADETIGSLVSAGIVAGTGRTLSAASYTFDGGSIEANLGSGALTQRSGTTTLNGSAAATTVAVSGGTLLLGAANRLTALPTVTLDAGGTLDLAGHDQSIGSLAGSGAVSLGSGRLTVDGGGSYAGSLSGSGGLSKAGAGVLTLSGSNSYSGATQVQAGTLALAGGTALADDNAVTVATGATLQLQADETVGSLVSAGTLAGSGRTLTAAAYTFDGGRIDANLGGGTLTQRSGSTTLNGTAAATTVAVSGGTLLLGAAERLASGAALTVSGGSLDLGGFTQTLGSVTLTAGSIDNGTLAAGSMTVQAGSIGANLTGSGTLTKSGSGTVVLSGVNSYSGATLIQDGTLRAGGSQAFSANSTVTLADAAGAVLDLNGTHQSIGALAGGGASGGNVSLGGGRLTVGGNGADSSYAGRISGGGGLTKAGGGTLSLTGSNDYVGPTRVQGGILAVNSDAALGATASAIELQGGTLQVADGFASSRSISVSSASGLNAASGTASFSGAIDGTGSLSFSGNGSVVVSGDASAYGGAASVAAGRLQVDGSFGNGSASLTVASAATLSGNGSIDASTTLADGARLAPGGSTPGTLSFDRLTLNQNTLLDFRLGTPFVAGGPSNDLVVVRNDFVLDGVLNITTAAPSGAYRLFDYNTVGGSFTDNGLTVGTRPVGSQALVSVTPGAVNLILSQGGQSLQFWDGANSSATGIINGGSGTWNASATNWTDAQAFANRNWAGQIGIFQGSAGTVTVVGNQSFEGLQFSTSGYRLVAGSGGSLTLAGDSALNTAASFVTVDAGVSAELALLLVGGKGLDKLGSGTLLLSGANSYQGATTVQAGTLALTGGAALADDNAVTVWAGATLQLQADETIGSLVSAGTIAGTGRTLSAASYSLGGGTIDANLGAGTLTQTGGLTRLNGSAAASTLAISGGTLQLGAAERLAGNAALTVNGGTLDLGGYSQTLATVSLTAGGIDHGTLSAGSYSVQSGSIGADLTGSGGLTKSGAGTVLLSGSNSYSGATQVQAGTLALAGGAALADDNAVTVAAGATLQLQTDETVGSLVSAGTIAGAGRTLSAATYTFDGGTINANLGSGAPTQRSGSTTLNGTAAAATVAVSGGTLLLGAAERLAAGASLTVSGGSFDLGGYAQTLGTVTLTAGSIDHGTLAAGSTTVQAGSIGANLTGSGTLTKSGSGTVVLSGSNSYSGATLIQDGRLLATADGRGFSANSAHTLGSGATLDLAGTQQSIGSLAGNGVVALGAGQLTTGGNGLSTSYDGQIGGAGRLVKTGGGTLTLTGTNSYSGGTTLAQGRLAIGADAALGAASGALLLAGGTLQTAGDISMQRGVQVTAASGIDTTSGTLTLGSGLAGSGALLKTGAGTLALTAAGTYSGELTLAAGTLALEASGALGSGSLRTTGSTVAYADGVTHAAPIVLAGNSTQLQVASGSATQSGAISADGGPRPLEKTGAGTLVLTGSNSYSGPTTISAGTLVANTASLSGDVDIRGTLRFDQSIDATYAGRVSGSGQWIKDGTGTLAYSGDGSAFVGTAQVAAGTLLVNQSLGGSIAVASGATLAGSGQVGSLQLAGTIAPAGSSIGTLTVAGNLTVAAGSSYQVQLRPSTQPVAGTDNDLIAVQGQTTLQGGVVELDPLAGRYRGRVRYTLLTSEGGVSGQFAGISTTLPVSALFARYTLGYGADEVWLDISAGDFAASAATINQRAVGTALDREFLVGPGPLDPLYAALFTLPDAASAQAAYDSLSGEVHASALQGVAQTNRAFEQTVATRLRSGRGGSWLSPVAADAPAAGADGLWVAPIVAGSTVDGDGNASGSQMRDYGIALGYDQQIGDALRAGLALGGNNARTRLDRSNAGSASYDGFQLGAYLSWRPQRWRVDGQVYGGQQWLRSSRTVAVGSSVENYTASYTVPALGAAVEAAWRLPLEAPVALAPFAGAAYQQLWRPAATESAGALGAQLALASQTSSSAPVWLGLESELPVDAAGWRGAVGLRLGWVGQLGNTDLESQASFALAPATTAMTVYGVPLARSSALLGLRLDLARAGGTQFALEYSGIFGGGISSNTGRLAVSWAF